MLLSSVILILQEILEASLVLSLLLAFSSSHQLSRRWAWLGIGAGVVIACIYASQIDIVSTWFDYVGLEVVNASIQWSISLCLLIFAALYTGKHSINYPKFWYGLMSTIVALTLAREGFEILLYGMNFINIENLWTPVLLGSLLGAGIGVSIGALLYYALIAIPSSARNKVQLGLLALFGGNMAAQGTLLLIQADWLPSGEPLWNLNFLIAEHSLLGRLLYAMIGYEASPTAFQAGAYLLQTLLIITLFNVSLPGNKKIN